MAGRDFATRGKRLEEGILALKAIWTTDPVEFDGEFYSIPRSVIGPKPVPKPHPPIYMGAFAPGALARIARVADGWIAVAFPTPQLPRRSRASRRARPKQVEIPP